LHLNDWRIALVFNTNELELRGKLADVVFSHDGTSAGDATIRMLDYRRDGWERTLVHELLHLKMARYSIIWSEWGNKMVRGAMERREDEIVSELAEIMVALK
jgi:hypothetical protein